MFKQIGTSLAASGLNSAPSEGLAVTRPTDNGAVVQLVFPSLALRNYVMRLPAALPLDSTARQAKRDSARNSMLMTVRPALTRRHRPHPRFTQDLCRESQLASQESPKQNFQIYRFSFENLLAATGSLNIFQLRARKAYMQEPCSFAWDNRWNGR